MSKYTWILDYFMMFYLFNLGVASSFHIWTNVSLRRGISRGTSVHSVSQGRDLMFSSVYKRGSKDLEKILTIDPIHVFIH